MRIFGGGSGGGFGWRVVSDIEALRRRLRHYVARRDAVDAEYTMVNEDQTGGRQYAEPGKITGE